MSGTPPLTPIHAVQGSGLYSPFSGRSVRVRGIVTGHSRKGYFLQDPEGTDDPLQSTAIFVFSPRRKAQLGLFLEVLGKVVDYAPDTNARPTTQLKALEVRLIGESGPRIDPLWLTAANLVTDPAGLARFLNGLEGMLVGIEAGATFIAPSNPFGDYVLAPPGLDALRSESGGVLVDPAQPERWFPGLRQVDYRIAPRVDVGARLLAPVIGPLNYRAASYQISAQGPMEVENAKVVQRAATLQQGGAGITVLTLNGFNLDVHVESEERVDDPGRDIDDDKLYGRFELLARAIVEQAGAPDIVALQEIQDNDGAEITSTVDATETYLQLIRDIRRLGGPDYRWADVPPQPEADGGQPGGNIRCAFLYNRTRVELTAGSLTRVGVDDPAFSGSRKPLMASFSVVGTGAELVVVNVHLASKRHQHSIFSPDTPGHDPREATRIRQAEVVRQALGDARARGVDFYVTGDFNDFEFSPTLRTLCGDDSVNLVETLPPHERFDYNHRGLMQALMHGVVARRQHDAGAVEYQILHGNELTGVEPGSLQGKATDHAYVLARLRVGTGA